MAVLIVSRIVVLLEIGVSSLNDSRAGRENGKREGHITV